MKIPEVEVALILAAGMGSRLDCESPNPPKPLVPVDGVPLLKRVVLSALGSGIENCVVVLGYRAKQIKENLAEDRDIGSDTVWVENKDYSDGVIGSVLAGKDFISDEPFVLLMGDHLFDPSVLQELLTQRLGLRECILAIDKKIGSILDISDATKLLLNGDTVVNMGKELAEFNAIDTGMFLCGRTIFNVLSEIRGEGGNGLSDMVKLLSERGCMGFHDIGQGRWQDVDTPMALQASQNRELW